MTIKEKLIDYVFNKSDLDKKSEIPLEKSLLSEGILDSLGILELIEYIEEDWQIKIEDDEFTQENFGSIKKIESFISKKLHYENT